MNQVDTIDNEAVKKAEAERINRRVLIKNANSIANSPVMPIDKMTPSMLETFIANRAGLVLVNDEAKAMLAFIKEEKTIMKAFKKYHNVVMDWGVDVQDILFKTKDKSRVDMFADLEFAAKQFLINNLTP